MMKMKNKPDSIWKMLQFSVLEQDRNIFHFMTTRHGGVSRGSYASLNLGAFVEDDPEAWQANRRRLCARLGIDTDHLFVPYQTHETGLCDIDASFLTLPVDLQKEKLHGIDALVTAEPGVCLAVTTADCVPLLIYAPDKRVVASIHAGWRGTVAGIAAHTVTYMMETYQCDPQQMRVGIGASVSPARFEVGDEVAAAFSSITARYSFTSFVHPHTGKVHLDLPAINRCLLVEKGVPEENIEQSDECTYTNAVDFFSARREGIRSGRMLTGILIKE